MVKQDNVTNITLLEKKVIQLRGEKIELEYHLDNLQAIHQIIDKDLKDKVELLNLLSRDLRDKEREVEFNRSEKNGRTK